MVLGALALVFGTSGVAQAHTTLYFTNLTDGVPSWEESNFLVEGYHTTDGGATLDAAHIHSDSWTQGNAYAYGHADDANWIVFSAPGDLLAPVNFYIARRSGSQQFVASSGAQVSVSGSVGDLFAFPTTAEWSDLDWVALHVTSGELGVDNFNMFACPDPTIPGPFNVGEGGGTILFGSTENQAQAANWDLDGDGEFDDGIGFLAAFDATNIDGPATVSVALQVSVDCGDAGVLTSSVASEVNVLNVAPTIDTLTIPDTAQEGESLTLEIDFSDPAAADTHTIDLDFGDSSTVQAASTSESHAYVDEGLYTVTATVTDDDGESDQQTSEIHISNVAPTIDSISMPDGLEGQSLSFSATASDPGINDVLSFAWDFGDGNSATGLSASHAYVDDGAYWVTFTADDGDGGLTEEAHWVTVTNVAPTVDVPVVASTVNEGDIVSLSATATDPGGDVVSWTWDFGDGTPGSSGNPVSHTWADEGSYTVVATANDGDEGLGSNSTTVEVQNVPPSITSLALPDAEEGSPVLLSAVVTDPGADALTVSWDLGDGATATGSSVTHTYADQGTYTINAEVTDGDGGSDSLGGTVVVTNASPTISSFTGNTTGQEGQELTWTAAVTDPGGGDSLSYSWDFGDGATAASGATQQHSYSASDTYVVTLTVTDGDGGTTSASLNVTISNDGPNITSISATTGQEGSPVTLSATATDPDNDTLTFSWSPGDGSDLLGGDTATHIYQEDGTYTAALSVTDSEGLLSSATVAVFVTNASPLLSATSIPTEGLEGETVTFSAEATDPSPTDEANLTYTWTFDDGSDPKTGATVTHEFPDNGSYFVTVTVADPDSGLDSDDDTIHITNVDPTITTTPPDAALVGSPYHYQPTAFDPADSQLIWTLSPSAPPGMTVHPTTGAVSWTPDGDDALSASVAVTLQVDDGDGGLGLQSWTISVSHPDSDGDGITDNWETLNGLDPDDPDDGLTDDDADGRSNLFEFENGTDPNDYNGPPAPEVLEPDAGQELNTATPDLVVSNPSSSTSEALSYEFEVYADPDLTQFMAATSAVPQGTDGTTSWKVDVPLPESTLFYWRSRITDAWVTGPYSDVATFLVDAEESPPPSPTAVYPTSGETVAQTYPELVWSAVQDVDGDEVWYSIEIRELDTQVIAFTADDVEDPGEGVTVTWQAPVLLSEDQWFEWAVMAVDETGLASDWSPSEPFFYSVQNAAPRNIAWVEPEPGADLATSTPELTVSAGDDPDGTIVQYLFEIDREPEFGTDDYQSRLLDPSGTETITWSLEDDELELPTNTGFYARVRGYDEEGLASVPATTDFFVRGEEEPPHTPQLLSPEHDATSLESPPTFVATRVEDPEGDLVFYEFVVALDTRLEDSVVASPAVLGGAGSAGNVDTTSWTPTETLPGGELYWSARAVDSFGNAGDWADPHRFALASEPAGVEPPADCNCTGARMVTGEEPGSIPVVLLTLTLVLLQRRRRAIMRPVSNRSAGHQSCTVVEDTVQ